MTDLFSVNLGRPVRSLAAIAVAACLAGCPADKTPAGPDPDPDPDPNPIENLSVALSSSSLMEVGTMTVIGTSGVLECTMHWTATASGTGSAVWKDLEWTIGREGAEPETTVEPVMLDGVASAPFTSGSQEFSGTWNWTASEGGHPRYRNFVVSVAMTYTQGGELKRTAPLPFACELPEPEVFSLSNGEPLSGVSAPSGYSNLYHIEVPEGTTSLEVSTTGGTGDLDLYVSHEVHPTVTSFACKSETETAAETCTITDPESGNWYALAYAWTDFSGVTITATASTEPGFTLSAPPSVSVAPGASATISVTATRTGGFEEAIGVLVENLPPGVDATPVVIEPGTTSASVVFTAAADAASGTTAGTIRGSATGMTDRTLSISITVSTTAPPPGGSGNVIDVLHSFVYAAGSSTEMPDGGRPESSPTVGSDGNLYGFTRSGGSSTSGSSGTGTVFRITPSGQLTTLATFDNNSVDGSYPLGGMAAATDGNLYGLTFDGVFYKVTTAGAVTKIVRNSEVSGSLGRLIQGQDGNFYGTTGQGGANLQGSVFRISAAGAVTTIASFTGSNGSIPSAGLVQAPDGTFYGTTKSGGANGQGTVFKMTSGGSITTLVSFTGSGAGKNGSSPRSQLVIGADGNLYGTTRLGGTYGSGTIFMVTPSGTLTTLHTFRLLEDGMSCNCGLTDPHGGLILANDGNFYGTTVSGQSAIGATPRGAVYRLTPAGEFSIVAYFAEVPGGAGPEELLDNLIVGPDGNLYGSSFGGGTADLGTVFRVNISGM